MNNHWQDLMRDATRLTQTRQLGAATQTIQRALRGLAAGGAVAGLLIGQRRRLQATRPA